MDKERLKRVISASVSPTSRLSSALAESNARNGSTASEPVDTPGTTRRLAAMSAVTRTIPVSAQRQYKRDRGAWGIITVAVPSCNRAGRPSLPPACLCFLPYLGYKTITPFGNRFNVARRHSTLAEQFSEDRNVKREVVVLYERIGQTFFIRSSLSTIRPRFSTSTMSTSRALGARDTGLAGTRQRALLGVEPKLAELVCTFHSKGYPLSQLSNQFLSPFKVVFLGLPASISPEM